MGFLAHAFTACEKPTRDPRMDAVEPVPVAIPARAPVRPAHLEDDHGLGALADELARLSSSCTSTCCSDVFQFGRVRYPDLSFLELRAIVASDARAPVKRLAIGLLVGGDDAEDIELLGTFADSTADAGWVPGIQHGQAMQRCYPVTFEHKTLGEAALGALARLAGIEPSSPWDAAAFRAWRARHGDLLREYDYYARKLRQQSYGHGDLLALLRDKDPELYFRVVLENWESVKGDVDDASVVELVRRRLGKVRLFAMLEGTEMWTDAAGGTFGEYWLTPVSLWILDRADAFFDASDAPELVSLWDGRAADRIDKSALAIAAARISPGDRARILTAAARNAPDPRVCAELATSDLLDDPGPVEGCFFSDFNVFGSEAATRVPILHAIEARGLSARSLLRDLVVTHGMTSEEAPVVEALMHAALSMNPRLTFPERGRIVGPSRGKGRRADDGIEGAAAAARRDCIARVAAWLV
jgi:hypothetical protein